MDFIVVVLFRKTVWFLLNHEKFNGSRPSALSQVNHQITWTKKENPRKKENHDV